MVAEDVRNLLHLDRCRRAGLGGVVVEEFELGAAPLFPLCPGDQFDDVVRFGQSNRLRSGWTQMSSVALRGARD